MILKTVMAFLGVVCALRGWTDDRLPPSAAEDTRLDARVTLRMKAEPLKDVLAEITRRADVTLRASQEVEDWEVSVFVRNLPLRTLQARLAEMLHLTWRKEEEAGKSPPAYTLYPSRRDREEVERLLSSGERTFRESMEAAIRALALSPEDLKPLAQTHPRIFDTLSQPLRRKATEILGQLSPLQRQRVYEGDTLRLPVGGAIPAGQARALFDAWWALAEREPISPQLTTVGIRRAGEGADSFVKVDVHWRQEGGGSGVVGAYVSVSADYESVKLIPKHEGSEYTDTHRRVQVDEPLTATTFADLLEKTADAFQINLLAENYRLNRDEYVRTLPAGETTLEKALDTLIWGGYYWWKRGDVYMVQQKRWFRDRQARIPKAEVERLRKMFKDQGALALEDWCQLGRLNRRQWMALQGLGLGEFDVMLDTHALLAFYTSLSPTERSLLWTRAGLPVSRLRSASRACLLRWIRERDPVGTGELSGVPVRVMGEAQKRQTLFRVFGVGEDGQMVVLCEQSFFALPRAAKKTKR